VESTLLQRAASVENPESIAARDLAESSPDRGATWCRCGGALYEQILARNQNHPAANFAIGRILLSRDDFNAIPMIKHAMELNSDYVPAGCVLIQELLWQHGREDNAEAYQRKAKEPKGLSRWRPRTTAGC
jgi:hypothetical protein